MGECDAAWRPGPARVLFPFLPGASRLISVSGSNNAAGRRGEAGGLQGEKRGRQEEAAHGGPGGSPGGSPGGAGSGRGWAKGWARNGRPPSGRAASLELA